MVFVFVDTETLCSVNCQRNLQRRAVDSCCQCCEIPIREVGRAYKIAGCIFQLPMKTEITSTAQLCRKATFTAD